MNDVLLSRVQQRASTLADSFAANDAAFKEAERAEAEYRANDCWQTAQARTTTAFTWARAREAIIGDAKALLSTLCIVLATLHPDKMTTLRKQMAYLTEAVLAEEDALNAYLDAGGGSHELRQAWQAAQGDVIDRARPLIGQANSISPTEVYG